MAKGIKALLAALALLLVCAGCGEEATQAAVSGTGQAAPKEVTAGQAAEEEQAGTPSLWHGLTQSQIEKEAEKLKERGIVDEHGKPAPGVDLNDYPGLG